MATNSQLIFFWERPNIFLLLWRTELNDYFKWFFWMKKQLSYELKANDCSAFVCVHFE